MKLFIDCPGGCGATGLIHSLGIKCPTCKGSGRITLTKYLKLIDHIQEVRNVAEYERYLTKTILLERQNVYSKPKQ